MLLRRVETANDRVDAIIKTEWTRTVVSDTLTDTSIDMVETTAPTQAADGQTQFGNARHLDPSDCIFVFKNTLSDYEEPPSDEEVSTSSRFLSLFLLRSLAANLIRETARSQNRNVNMRFFYIVIALAVFRRQLTNVFVKKKVMCVFLILRNTLKYRYIIYFPAHVEIEFLHGNT